MTTPPPQNVPPHTPETTQTTSSQVVPSAPAAKRPETAPNRRETPPNTLTSTSSHVVPTSSHHPGTTSKATSSPRPLPYGDEVAAESTDDHTHNPTSSHPDGTSSECPHCRNDPPKGHTCPRCGRTTPPAFHGPADGV